jgi:O-antigen/teichoic acid export membrane protein
MNKLNVISSNAALLSLASMVSMVFGLTRQMYIGYSLTPIEFGIYNFLFVLMAYANYADFGINNGVLHEASRAIGDGDLAVSKTMIQNGFSATVFVGLLLSIIIFTISYFAIDFFQENKVILRLFSLVIISTIILNYYQIELRIKERFVLLSFTAILSSICSLSFTIIFGVVYEKNDAEWMLFGWIIGPFISIILLSMYIRLKPSVNYNFIIIFKFIKIGVPLTILPLILTTFLGIDRWVLINIAEPKLLGFYALGCTLGMALYMIPNALGTVLLSNFLQDSSPGSGAYKTKESVSTLITSLIITSYIMSIILGAILILLPFALNYIFPEYIDGLEVISIVVAAYVILSFIPPLASYLIAYDGILKLGGILLFGLLCSGASSFLSYKYFGIIGVGLLLLFIFLIVVFLVLFRVSIINKMNNRLRPLRLLNLFSPFLITLILVYFINPYINIINIHDDIILLTKLLLIFVFLSSFILFIHAYLSGLLKKQKSVGVKKIK